jgi:hypothetical protein
VYPWLESDDVEDFGENVTLPRRSIGYAASQQRKLSQCREECFDVLECCLLKLAACRISRWFPWQYAEGCLHRNAFEWLEGDTDVVRRAPVEAEEDLSMDM